MTATVTSIIEQLVEKIDALTLYDEYLGRSPNGWRIYKNAGCLTITVCSGSLESILGWLEERQI